jgi:DNA-binding SARP family transcriptional activator
MCAESQNSQRRNPMRSAGIITLAVIALASMLVTLSVFWIPRAGLGFGLSGRTVSGVIPTSEAARSGLHVGDQLDPSLPFAARLRLLWYDDFRPGETVIVPIERSGSVKNIRVTAVQHPQAFTPVGELLMVLRILTYGIFVVVGALLVLLRPARYTWGFFLCCLGLATIPGLIGRAFSTFDATLGFTIYVLWFIAADLANVGFLIFALRFPSDELSGWRRVAWISLPAWLAFFIALDIWSAVAWYDGANVPEWAQWSTTIAGLAAWAVGTASMALTYRAAEPRNRKRLLWAIVGSSLGYLGWYVDSLLSGLGYDTAAKIAGFTTLAMPLSVGYTVLKYRVVDIRFALNRALTFSLLGMLLGAAFALTYFATASLLLQSHAAIAVQVAVALVAGASFHRLHRWIDAVVARFLFRNLRRTDARLGRACAALGSATTSASIESLLAVEPFEAMNLEHASVHRRQPDGSFARTSTAGTPCGPDRYDSDDPLVLLLKTSSRPLRPHEGSNGRDDAYALAVPIRDDVALHAIAFYGPHRNGFDLDSDEERLLGGLPQPAANAYRAIETRAAHIRRLAELLRESPGSDTATLFDYLADQILESLAAPERAILMACAAFPDATPVEVALVAGDVTGSSGLPDLARTTTFVRCTDAGRFAVHPALRDGLRRKLPDGGRDGVTRCASYWMQHENFQRAFELYVSAELRIEALAALGALLSHGQLAGVRREHVELICKCSIGEIASFPALLNVRLSEGLLVEDDPALREEANAYLERFGHRGVVSSTLAAWLAYSWSECGDHDRAIRILEQVDLDTTGLLVRAMIAGKRGGLSECAALIETANASSNPTSLSHAMHCLIRGVVVERSQGNWDRARGMLALAGDSAASPRSGWADLAHRETAVTAWLAGDLSVDTSSAPSEKPHVRWYPRAGAFAYMIKAAEAADCASALSFARRAAENAVTSGEHFVHVLALVCISELEPAMRDEHLAAAARLSDAIESTPLADALTSIVAGADNAGILTPLIRRMRAPRVGTVPRISVEFSVRRVLRDFAPISLAEGELSLLLALARSPRPSLSSELVDALWPNLDEPSGHKALQTCVYRLRSRLGDPAVVESVAQGYRLRGDTVVDLWQAERFLTSLQKDRALDRYALMRLNGICRSFGAGRSSPLDDYEWFAPIERRIADVLRTARLLLANHCLSEGKPGLALAYARDLIASDELDESGWHLSIRANMALGDVSEGRRDFRAYRDLLARELAAEPSSSMAALVAPGADGSPL